jgi:hypothetical protein
LVSILANMFRRSCSKGLGLGSGLRDVQIARIVQACVDGNVLDVTPQVLLTRGWIFLFGSDFHRRVVRAGSEIKALRGMVHEMRADLKINCQLLQKIVASRGVKRKIADSKQTGDCSEEN